jgi:diphosphomevalonate decarboxylase
LLIHEGQKVGFFNVGHGLMKTNPYAERRFQEARENFAPLKEILKSGDIQGFIRLVEHEALTLHAMMMMSEPAFILMKTGTLEVINSVWKYREETGKSFVFTLDAGANVHLLFQKRTIRSDTRVYHHTTAAIYPKRRRSKRCDAVLVLK